LQEINSDGYKTLKKITLDPEQIAEFRQAMQQVKPLAPSKKNYFKTSR
jgi:hypothetical protein